MVMRSSDGESSGGCSRGSSSTQGLKKGPWTAAEDAILMNYVKKHGEGNWNAVQRYSGLMRCGKSCRLRWANHLRPNLKKGAFSPDEERIIMELHAKLGNKWARMAAQLPGRTDNEIKNYWNTRLKRRQRAGLPIYPQEIQEKAATFHHQQNLRHKKPHNHQNSTSTCSSPPSQLLSSFLASPAGQNPPYINNPSFSFLNFSSPPQNPLQNHPSAATSLYSNPGTNNNDKNTGFSLPLSPVSPYYNPRPSTVNHFNSAQMILPPPAFQFSDMNESQYGMSFSSMMREATANNTTPTANNNISVDHPFDFLTGLESAADLPLNQMPPPPPQSTTPTNSSNSSSGGAAGFNNTGLLDDLVQEGQKLARGNDENAPKGVVLAADEKGKNGKAVMKYVSASDVEEEEDEEEEGVESVMAGNSGEPNADNQWDDLSSSFESFGFKAIEEPLEEVNSMDEDLRSLITNFPMSSMPVPDWYSNDNSNTNPNGALPPATMIRRNNSDPPPPATMEATASSSFCPLGSTHRDSDWYNMPRIC